MALNEHSPSEMLKAYVEAQATLFRYSRYSVFLRERVSCRSIQSKQRNVATQSAHSRWRRLDAGRPLLCSPFALPSLAGQGAGALAWRTRLRTACAQGSARWTATRLATLFCFWSRAAVRGRARQFSLLHHEWVRLRFTVPRGALAGWVGRAGRVFFRCVTPLRWLARCKYFANVPYARTVCEAAMVYEQRDFFLVRF